MRYKYQITPLMKPAHDLVGPQATFYPFDEWKAQLINKLSR